MILEYANGKESFILAPAIIARKFAESLPTAHGNYFKIQLVAGFRLIR